jgi:hypothetical protein
MNRSSNRSSRLLAGCAVFIAVLATASLVPSPAEAHWRPFWRPGFLYPGFYPRPAFYPRPFFYPRPVIYPRPIVYRPVYLPPPPPVYAAYVPPPMTYRYPTYRKRVVHRHRRVSHRRSCHCTTQPAAAPAPLPPAAEQPPAKGS